MAAPLPLPSSHCTPVFASLHQVYQHLHNNDHLLAQSLCVCMGSPDVSVMVCGCGIWNTQTLIQALCQASKWKR